MFDATYVYVLAAQASRRRHSARRRISIHCSDGKPPCAAGGASNQRLLKQQTYRPLIRCAAGKQTAVLGAQAYINTPQRRQAPQRRRWCI